MQVTDGWISGDGGPLIVLQAGAVPLWRGAADWDDSLMNGGSVETDYDVICRCADGVSIIERHGRDMLVLSDSEWAARLSVSPLGELVVVQCFGCDEETADLVARLTAAPASATHRFRVLDRHLRLLPGADAGDGKLYGFAEVDVAPGDKTCDVWYSDEAQVVVIRAAR